MIHRISTVFNKEFIDNFRDHRSVITVLLTSLFMPLFVVGLVVVMGRLLNPNVAENPILLPVVRAENAPHLVAYLKANGVTILPAPDDPNAAIQNGEYDVILVLPDAYASELAAGTPASIQLILDNSRMSASPSIQRVKSILFAYSRQMAAQKLMARGIDPATINPIMVREMDLATPQSQSLIFLNMLPYFVIMVIFMGGMYVVIDATAGERERGSLEPLLINPVRRSEFVMGKLLASLPYAIVILIICLVTIGLSFNLIPLEQFTGFPMSVSLSSLWIIFWICMPMVLLAGGLQMILASFTRSFKEAQTYLSFLPVVAGLPSAFLIFLPVKSTLWVMLIPAFGQGVLINQVMRSEAIDPNNVLVSILSTTVLAIISIAISIKLYQRESLLFGAK